MRNYYKVLEVSENASPEEIKKAYYKLIKQWHPDHNPHTPISDDMMKMYNEAYDVLSDPKKRHAYDDSIGILHSDVPSDVYQHKYSYKTEYAHLLNKIVAFDYTPMEIVFYFATVLFFGWLIIDSASSILLSRSLEGVYLTVGGKLVPFNLIVFVVIWFISYLIEGGFRAAAFISSLLLPPFWVVPLVTADMHDLKLNYFWLVSMIFSNVIFLIFAFFGKGTKKDLDLWR
jgi:hypothetical protein